MPSTAAPQDTRQASAAESAAAGTTGEEGITQADIHAELGLDPADTGEEGSEAEGEADETEDETTGEDEAAEDDETAAEDAGQSEDSESDSPQGDDADEAAPEGDAADAPDEESEAQDDAGDANEAGGDEEGTGTWPKGTPEWAKREISALRAQVRELRTESRPTPAQEAESPLLEAEDEAALAQLEDKYVRLEEFAEETLAAMAEPDWSERDEEGNPIAKVGGKTYTRAQLADAQRKAKRILRQAPMAHRFVQARVQSSAAARKVYPWIDDAKDPRAKMHAEAKKALPALRGVWNADMIVADAIVGQQLREAREKARAGKPGKPAATPTRRKPAGAPPPSGTRPPPRPTAAQTRAAKAATRLQEEGSVEALEDLVASQLEET